MVKIHAGATLTPGFREFLAPWVARQPWYQGTGVPVLAPVGFFRFEDPAGEVGVETHLVSDGAVLYQVPMTYRGAPLVEAGPGALVATAEHSVLGTRWIYDGEADPVWRECVLDMVRTGGVSESSNRKGVGPALARGEWLASGPLANEVRVELVRVPKPGTPDSGPDTVGLVTGIWYPDGPDTSAISGCLTLVKAVIQGPAT
ncbi:hypothetical protein ALI22I_29495 [Saccharothrix sp. ALI-22-I]|uniref:maltokinase N-terminal cap-like domain-containing protein n=1 Tax=Saccharothrix sp. ALI-22-I TaxID=1933778 RepID=UPI00097CA814|nr:hypothetical protein [Saccharothrix sp. ALI-22-I]ONI84669.1 hypothetical protein ALI22I_29495 [Saccharothrix sp. ALI-22-I]